MSSSLCRCINQLLTNTSFRLLNSSTTLPKWLNLACSFFFSSIFLIFRRKLIYLDFSIEARLWFCLIIYSFIVCILMSLSRRIKRTGTAYSRCTSFHYSILVRRCILSAILWLRIVLAYYLFSRSILFRCYHYLSLYRLDSWFHLQVSRSPLHQHVVLVSSNVCLSLHPLHLRF